MNKLSLSRFYFDSVHSVFGAAGSAAGEQTDSVPVCVNGQGERERGK